MKHLCITLYLQRHECHVIWRENILQGTYMSCHCHLISVAIYSPAVIWTLHHGGLVFLQKFRQENITKASLLNTLWNRWINSKHLAELNKDLVEKAILVVRSLVANQIDWRQIGELLDEAKTRGDPVALSIKELKLEKNTIALSLR